MAQTFFNSPSLGDNATANHSGASTAPGDALARASAIPSAPDNKDPFITDEAMDTTPDFPDQNPNASGVLEMSWQPVPSPCAHSHTFYLLFHIPPHDTCPSRSLLLAETTIPTVFYLYSMHLPRLPSVVCLPNR